MTANAEAQKIVCSECGSWFPSHEADTGPKGFRCSDCSKQFYAATSSQRMAKYFLALSMMLGGVTMMFLAATSLMYKTSTLLNIMVMFGVSLFLLISGGDLFSKTRPPKKR